MNLSVSGLGPEFKEGDEIVLLEPGIKPLGKGKTYLIGTPTHAMSAPVRLKLDPKTSTASGQLQKNGKLFKRIGDMLLNTQTKELFPIRIFTNKERQKLLAQDRYDHVVGSIGTASGQ